MYAVMGITGKVGGAVARELLAAGKPVRAVLRDPRKAQPGWDIAKADINDAAALAKAFDGTEAVFILAPPVFDPKPGYPEAQAVADSVAAALRAAKPDRVVYLSTIGADASEDNLLSQHTIIEAALKSLSLPLTFLRPGWFLDNALWDVAPARDTGRFAAFLQPLDRAIAMVATEDVGRLAAQLLQESWNGQRIVELEGPSRVSSNDLAAAFAQALGHPVRAEPVPPERWEGLFREQGMQNPTPRIRMLSGFNEGWIGFQDGSKTRKGRITATELIAAPCRDSQSFR